MDINQIRSLVAIVNHGTLSRAAEALHLSQPAISSHIKLLENELGAPLFERHTRGMSLTDYGASVHAHALRILATFDVIKKEAAERLGNLSGELVLGVNDSATARLPTLLRLLRQRAPELRLTLVQATSGAVARMVGNGEFDVGFVEGDPGIDVVSTVIAHAEFVIGYPKAWGHRIDHDRPVSIFSLPWIGTPEECSFHRLTTALFSSHGFEFSPALRTDQESLLADLVAQESGVSLMRRAQAEAAHGQGLSIFPEMGVKTAIHFVSARRPSKPSLVALVQRSVLDVWREPLFS